MRRVNYGHLAAWLRALDLHADCGDLAGRLADYRWADDEYRAQLVRAVQAEPSTAEVMCGLFRICELLQADNPRFQPGLFLEACVDDK